MNPEIVKQIVPAIAGLVAALIAVAGWFVAHRLNVARDADGKRRELRIQYLLEAYRRLESNANRPPKSTDADREGANREFESAIADIQLLGTPDQIEALQGFIDDMQKPDGARNINYLLSILRADLRQELDLGRDDKKVMIFRFTGNEKRKR